MKFKLIMIICLLTTLTLMPSCFASASVGFTVTGTRSWSTGTRTSVVLPVQPGNFGKISGYCPAVTTSGGFVYKVYNIDVPSNYWYETTPVSGALAPAETYIHYVTEQHPYIF